MAVVGVTGAVGQEFLSILAERDFPLGELKLLASERSAGKQYSFKGETLTVESLKPEAFEGVDIALFSAGSSVSKEYAPVAARAGATVVDNSSAFRMDPQSPLVIPEVNGEALEGYEPGKGGIVANPNCSTIIMLVATHPIHRAAGVERMVVSTYQSASGAGAAAMSELERQSRDVLDGRRPEPDVLPHVSAFNVFSHNSDIDENGYNGEEMKMVRETRKIWGDPRARVAATCVRVPVMRAHAESINLELAEPLSPEAARSALAEAPGVSVVDDREANHFPMPVEASGRDPVYVGRIRRDISREDERGLELFACGDQLRKGAALNAVQIAEHLVGLPLRQPA